MCARSAVPRSYWIGKDQEVVNAAPNYFFDATVGLDANEYRRIVSILNADERWSMDKHHSWVSEPCMLLLSALYDAQAGQEE